MRPKIFIASAKESVAYARALQKNLEPPNEVTVWDQDLFQLSRVAIDSLVNKLRDFDYAVLVCTPDDRVTSRGVSKEVPRDNVVFELGLCIGLMGLDRVFVVTPSDVKVNLPTDFDAVTYATFMSGRSDLVPALGNAAHDIMEKIKETYRGRRADTALNKRTYVAAVCYKIIHGEPHFLLVNSSLKRWIVPKGLVLEDETMEAAARRYAHDEAGVVGTILKVDPIEFKYLKEDLGTEQRITAFLIETSSESEPQQTFRNPKWFNFKDAEDAIALRRHFNAAEPLRLLIRQSHLHIAQQNVEPKHQVAALPFRRSREGQIEFAMVTSRNTTRYTLPKGNLSNPPDTIVDVAREAMEEAGLEGRVQSNRIFSYSYIQRFQRCVVDVYPMEVTVEHAEWQESNVRFRRWFTVGEIDRYIEEATVRDGIRAFITSAK